MADLLGIDCSNYSGVPSVGALDDLKSRGVTWAIPGTQTGMDGHRYTQQQIEALEGAGINVPSVYVFLDFDGSDVSRVEDAFQFGKFIWLDVEMQSTNVGMLRDAVKAAGTRIAGIYTGRYYPIWQHTGAEFANLPLWHADYRDASQADNIFEHFVPYAGWTRPTIWQFQGTTNVQGFGADFSLYREPALPPPPPTPPPTPPLPPVPNPLVVLDHIEAVYSDGFRRIFREVPQ